MQYPADLRLLSGAQALGGAYAVLLTIPAPGAGFIIRVWRYAAGVFTIAPGAAIYTVALGDTLVGNLYDAMTYHATTGSGERSFPGGLRHPGGSNRAISLYGAASVGVTVLVSAQYTIEAV